jgi:esterase/lipase
MGKLLAPNPATTSSVENKLANLKAAAMSVQQIRLSAQRELELAKHIRAEAQRYQQETATKARSQAQQLILQTRLTTQKEIKELVRTANTEIQKILADMRVIRATAQEELAAQKKFTDAARLCSLSLSLQEETRAPEAKKKQPLACKQ